MIEKTYSFINNGNLIEVFTLSNSNGIKVEICNHGGRILSILTPDKNGVFSDITIGYKHPEDYFTKPHAYYGACIGRYCDRIEKARFSLGGTTYYLGANENGDCNHGGNVGFDQRVMDAKIVDDTLVLKYLSPDGEEGFPGNLDFTLCYALSEQNELILTYTATSDKDTVCNFTNHTYFNIGDHDTVHPYFIKVNASFYTPYDSRMICHGEFASVSGTKLDLRNGVNIGEIIGSDEKLIRGQNGLDLTIAIDKTTQNDLEYCATLYDDKSGRAVKCYSTLPGIQIYTANHHAEENPTETYKDHCGLCMETQYFSNSPNCPTYPTTTLKKGETYHSKTIYKFEVI